MTVVHPGSTDPFKNPLDTATDTSVSSTYIPVGGPVLNHKNAGTSTLTSLGAAAGAPANTNSVGTGPDAPNAGTRGSVTISTNDSSAAGVSMGNSFFTPGALTAVFMNMTEMNNIMRQVAYLSNQLKRNQMDLALSTAKDISSIILASAKVESDMHIASGIGSVVQSAVSFGTAAASVKAMGAARKEAGQQKESLKNAADASDGALSTNRAKLDEAKINTQKQQAKVDSESQRVSDGKQDTSRLERRQERLTEAKKTQADRETRFEDAQIQANKDRRAHDTFSVEGHVGEAINTKTMIANQLANGINKLVDASVEFAKAAMTLEKGVLDAEKTLLEAYQQLAFKGIDNAGDQEKAAHDLISAFLQYMTKLSDDERKLGGSIGVQSAA